jgi:Hpt domain
MGSDQQFDAIYQQLRREYLAEADERLAGLRADVAAFVAGRPGALASLKTRFHQLAGSGGAYGFSGVGKLARETELWIATGPTPDAQAVARLHGAIRELEAEFARARSAMA